ncbi:MAG TPA: dihydropteroate synthase [candidate division Zixibacteria bacterium]|jgi:dihydropteroate synthase|nr:dihydropteroate synthase [candidate division Zixibacteria bacterium]
MAGRGELKGLGQRPLIMGIVNVTPDSFSDGGDFFERDKAIELALRLADDGADIIDIGGESTRPNAQRISADEELSRVMPVVETVAPIIKIPLSIDTTRSEVAARALDAGVAIVNDISALHFDEKIGEVAAKNGAYLILMHMRGTPADMQYNTKYKDLIGEIHSYLSSAAEKAIALGMAREKIIIDPGIGFGKSVDGNFTILKNLHRFLDLGYPLLVGASRKSFIGKKLEMEERIEGSLAAACYAVLNGADIVRVHDVAETKRALEIIEQISGAAKV